MARSLRFQYPGAFYHVLARGNRRQEIFLSDEDRASFLRTLGDACERTGWRVHAWVLMGNHYHLVVETPEPNLVVGMQWLQNTFTRRFNTRHQLWGRLFGDRYKAIPIEGHGYYYETLLDYVHLNPARAGLVRPRAGGSILDYAWSSVAAGYALAPRRRAKWLAAEAGLEAFGFSDTTEGRRGFVERLDGRALEEPKKAAGVPAVEEGVDRRHSNLRRGWYWGSQKFAERLHRIGEGVFGAARHRHTRRSAENRAHGEVEARRMLKDGLARLGWTRADLKKQRGSEPNKVAIAAQIFQETTVSQSWIAEELHMRSAENVAQQIRRHRLRNEKP